MYGAKGAQKLSNQLIVPQYPVHDLATGTFLQQYLVTGADNYHDSAANNLNHYLLKFWWQRMWRRF